MNPTSSFACALTTVDVVLLTLKEGTLQVLLLKRENEPFAGVHALPGGFIHPQEDADVVAAAERVLATKLGLKSPYLEQLQVFSGPARDPRGWSVSCALFALVQVSLIETVLQSVPGSRLVPVDARLALPFDHADIVRAAVSRVRIKGAYSSLPCLLAPETFTLSELQQVYSAVLEDRTLHKPNFRDKLSRMQVLEEVPGEKRADGPHRPAQVYRLKAEFRHRLHLLERGL